MILLNDTNVYFYKKNIKNIINYLLTCYIFVTIQFLEISKINLFIPSAGIENEKYDIILKYIYKTTYQKNEDYIIN